MSKQEEQKTVDICNQINDAIAGKPNKVCIEMLEAIADDIVSTLRSFGVEY